MSQLIVVVDYDTGNVGSVLNMLKKAGARAVLSRDPEVLSAADKLVLPGVGAFDEAIGNLRRFGLYDLLDELVLGQRKPIMGVCLGAQIMTKSSEEGRLPGFGWLDARLVRFRAPPGETLRVPHMGWNIVIPTAAGAAIFDQVAKPMRFYFVHSYHMLADTPGIEAGTTTYGHPFASALVAGNIVALQFHPEKSHKYGLQVYRNFVTGFQPC